MCVFWYICIVLTAAGVGSFTVTTSTPDLSVPENKGVDLKCTYSADFGVPRIEWKFKDLQGSQVYVIFDNKPTENYKSRAELYRDGLRLNTVSRKDTGQYICDVSSQSNYGAAAINLVVEVPPSVPNCAIPASVTTGSYTELTCHDPDGSPPSTYRWFKDDVLLPENPGQIQGFENQSYILNPTEGTLIFPMVSKKDAGKYYCMASNGKGPSQSCAAQMMTVSDVNVGGIVAGVIVALLILVLLAMGAYVFLKKSKRKPKAEYSAPTAEREDGEFTQKSSFVV